MAFMKYAYADVVHPLVTRNEWGNIRTAAKAVERTLNGNLVSTASEIFGSSFDPNSFLLTHATIVASVDTYEPPGTKMGSVLEDGFRVNRRFGDYRVKTGCDKFINNNQDCWSRGVIMAAHQTFIGAHNFVEHVQVEDLSKGRIIDAVARDIGDSVYVDILLATAREHADLCKAIENNKMGTLSMGCTVDGTLCTKCGHWAADETEMCPHIKYQKGNIFFDNQGNKHRIAELCGHESLAPTGGVHFIEASWVQTPAFTGAVLRNVLEPTAEISRRATEVLSEPPPQWSAEDQLKAASLIQDAEKVGEAPPDALFVTAPLGQAKKGFTVSDNFLAGWDDEMGEGDEGGEDEGEPEAPKSPFNDLEEELAKHMMDRVRKRIKDDMGGEKVQDMGSSQAPNNNLVKQGRTKRAYWAGLRALIRTAASDAHLLDAVAQYNGDMGIPVPVPLYRAALKLGRHDQYGSVSDFLRACSSVLGRQPSSPESRTLARLSKLITMRSAGGATRQQGATK